MDIDATLERWHGDAERIAIATVIAVQGSAPRAPGARLAFTASGRMAGSVSGGCVESDVCRRARDVIVTGTPAVASFVVGESGEHGVGLSCGGSIEVLVEPFADDDVWRACRNAARRASAYVRVVAVAPQALMGLRMMVTATAATGSVAATGAVDVRFDSAIAAHARALLDAGGDAAVQTISVEEGSISLFFEPVLPASRLFIVGATDTACALTPMAKLLGYRVVVIDGRDAYVSRERFPDADELVCAWPAEVMSTARLDEHSHVVTLTHDSKLDLPALAVALRSPACYVGALGSRRTHEKRKQSLRELGFGESDIERIHAPIGLDLGGRSPEEIALSIASELVASRYGRDPRALVAREPVASVRRSAQHGRISAVILAAGSSLRMGRPKQLLRLGAKTLLDHAIDAALGSSVTEVVVVLGAHAAEIRSSIKTTDQRLRFVLNERHADGISTSLGCGITACDPESEAAAILLADQPGVDAELVEHMLEAFARRRASVLRPMFGECDGTSTPGHPVLLARTVWPLLERLEADEGARVLMLRHPELVDTVEIARGLIDDVDTPEDYHRVCAAAERVH